MMHSRAALSLVVGSLHILIYCASHLKYVVTVKHKNRRTDLARQSSHDTRMPSTYRKPRPFTQLSTCPNQTPSNRIQPQPHILVCPSVPTHPRPHRGRPDGHEWSETRPYAALSASLRAQTFAAGTLRSAGELALNALRLRARASCMTIQASCTAECTRTTRKIPCADQITCSTCECPTPSVHFIDRAGPSHRPTIREISVLQVVTPGCLDVREGVAGVGDECRTQA